MKNESPASVPLDFSPFQISDASSDATNPGISPPKPLKAEPGTESVSYDGLISLMTVWNGLLQLGNRE